MYITLGEAILCCLGDLPAAALRGEVRRAYGEAGLCATNMGAVGTGGAAGMAPDSSITETGSGGAGGMLDSAACLAADAEGNGLLTR